MLKIFREWPFKTFDHPTGCFAVCRYSDDKRGIEQFEEPSIVPDDWRVFISVAVNFLRTNPRLLTTGNIATLRSDWEPLLNSANPYLAITAARVLSASGLLRPTDIEVLMSSSDPRVAASAICAAELNGWCEVDSNKDWLLERVASAKGVNELEAIAVAQHEVFDFLTLYQSAEKMYSRQGINITEEQVTFNRKLLGAVRMRLTHLVPKGNPSDDAWSATYSAYKPFFPDDSEP
ncbi:MAG TPA: hypothetical protein VGK19_20165 [Capsulimonadaceae bacterium]|jgi:hypothetical protein